MKYPLWKPILIVVVLGLFAWVLAELPLRKGLDLAGGTTLIYDVRLPEDAGDQAGMIDDMIDVLRDRIDPGGIRNLQWRRIAGNRIEIQMALAGEEVKRLRAEWVAARDALLSGNLSDRDVEAALRLQGAERDARLDAMAGGNAELRQALSELAAAHDHLVALREPYQQLQQQLREMSATDSQREELQRQLTASARAVYQAQQAYEQLSGSSLTGNVTATELQRVVDQPNTADRANQPTRRQAAADELKAKHPTRAAQIDAALAAYAAYETRKGPLDDPNDLIAMLRGSGVLEFRIAATADRPVDVETYRRQLSEEGPRGGAGRPWRWFPIDKIEQFADTRAEREALDADPVAFFLSPERGSMIGQRYGDDYYLLLADTPDMAMTRAQEWQLRNATRSADQLGKPAVAFTTDARGASLMGTLTGDNVGRPMAIMLDGKVMSAPNLRDRIRGNGIITGDFSQQELNYLLRTLKAGSTEAELGEYPISIKTTGPQLGEDNLRAGMRAAVISLIAVAAFMLVYYLLAGAIADFALFANMVLILGVMALFEATFTLPGIAGIVLTIGMAVDANVLIFERIREETERGAEIHVAVKQGFAKALSTILDANITTMITCVVLFYTATADIKGFAQTLMVGILATLFTALFCTRVLVDMAVAYGGIRRVPMLPTSIPALGRLLSPNVNWLGLAKYLVIVSAVLVVLGVVAIYERGADMLDIEFRSGTQVSFRLGEGKTLAIDEVRRTLADYGAAGAVVRSGATPSADLAPVVAQMRPIVERADARFEQARADAERLLGENKDPGDVPQRPVDFALLGEALIVTEGESDGLHAAAFNVSTLITDSQAVSDVVKEAFREYVPASRPLDFAGVEENRVESAPVYPIRATDLGDNINRPDVRRDVSQYRGGVAVVLDNLQPAATIDDIAQRVRNMRLQPAYEQLGFRDFTVVGLDLAGEGATGDRYRSAVVLTHDSQTDYARNPEIFTDAEGLAATEWQLVRDALTRDTSLASVSNFSSQVSDTMKQQAFVAIGLSLLAIVVYIWFRFGSLRYGVAAIAALVHDVLIALGLLAASAWVYDALGPGNFLLIEPFKINIAIVAAVLTIIGYSLNDTIIVFDRIRENRGRLSYATPQIINDSINQTISRTVLTSGTTLLAIFILYVVGGQGVHGFAFAMLIGVLVGTYSSIAIASPLLLIYKLFGKGEKVMAVDKAA